MNFCTLLDILKSIKHKFICFSSTPIPTPRSAPLQNRIFVNKQPWFCCRGFIFPGSTGGREGRAAASQHQGEMSSAVSARWDQALLPTNTSSASSWLELLCQGRCSSALSEMGELHRRRANKADCQDNPFPCGICAFISIFFSFSE